MSTWALVPVKRRSAAKQRLAGRLPPAVRLELTRTMLGCVVDALRKSRLIDHVAFASAERDTIPLEFALLPDAGGGLNAVLDDARRSLLANGAAELLVLPADLPFVTAADIDAVVESGRRSGFALATDRAGRGTNALYLRAASPFRFRFGPDSRASHVEEAARAGWLPVPVESAGLSFDVDESEDFDRLLAAGDPRYRFPAAASGGNAWPVQRAMQAG